MEVSTERDLLGGEIRRNEATTNTNGAAVAGDLAADSVRAPMNIQQDVVLREETTHSHRRSREEHERSMRAFTNFEGSRVVQCAEKLPLKLR